MSLLGCIGDPVCWPCCLCPLSGDRSAEESLRPAPFGGASICEERFTKPSETSLGGWVSTILSCESPPVGAFEPWQQPRKRLPGCVSWMSRTFGSYLR